MWCKNCNIETNETICPVCGSETIEDVPVETEREFPLSSPASALKIDIVV